MKKLFNETKFINEVLNLTQFEPDFKSIFKIPHSFLNEIELKTTQNFETV